MASALALKDYYENENASSPEAQVHKSQLFTEAGECSRRDFALPASDARRLRERFDQILIYFALL
jgi:hypothetical protein